MPKDSRVYVLNISMSIGELDSEEDLRKDKPLNHLVSQPRRGALPELGERLNREDLPSVFQVAINPTSDTELTADEKLESMVRLSRTATNELNSFLSFFMRTRGEFGENRDMIELYDALRDGSFAGEFTEEDTEEDTEETMEEVTEQELNVEEVISLIASDTSPFLELDRE